MVYDFTKYFRHTHVLRFSFSSLKKLWFMIKRIIREPPRLLQSEHWWSCPYEARKIYLCDGSITTIAMYLEYFRCMLFVPQKIRCWKLVSSKIYLNSTLLFLQCVKSSRPHPADSRNIGQNIYGIWFHRSSKLTIPAKYSGYTEIKCHNCI